MQAVSSPPVPASAIRRSRPEHVPQLARFLLLLPALAVLLLFGAALVDLLEWSLYPTGRIGGQRSGDIGLQTYIRIFSDPLYLSAIFTTFRLSAIATVTSLALGLPIAFWIVRTPSSRMRAALIILVAIPFMTSLIVRLYALMLMLGNTGLINRALHAMGILPENDFIPLIRNDISVAIGLTYFVLPFVTFTLAGGFRRYDRTLEEAAQSLGADEVSTFFRITLPLLAPGILAAGTLAFVLAGTAFATPLILGGSSVRMLANMIYDQAMVSQNMPVAAALSAFALGFTLLCLFVAGRIARWRRIG